MINATAEFPTLEVPDTVQASIVFSASYAQYHDAEFTPSQRRDVYADSIDRRLDDIHQDFEKRYDRSGDARLSVESIAREHLNEMRTFELDAPAAAPPARNPFLNRLRRITGNLSNSAQIRVT